MDLTENVKTLDVKIVTKFCPYKGEFDWQIECMGERCMKYDTVKMICARN